MKKTRSRRGLPNLRPQVYSFPEPPDSNGRTWSPPSEAQWTTLLAQHHLAPTSELLAELEDAAFWLRGDQQTRATPTRTQRRQLLGEIAQRAADLKSALDMLGIPDTCLLIDSSTRRLSPAAIAEDCDHLRWTAVIAKGLVPNSKRGAHGDGPATNLVYRLFQIWRRERGGTGAPRITKSAAGEYSGKFFAFVKDTFRLLEVRYQSETALGKRIEKVFALVRKRDRDNPRIS